MSFLAERSSHVAGSVQATRAVELVDLTEGSEQWEEWESSQTPIPLDDGTEDPAQQSRRSRKEERYLWGILAELDRELSRQEAKEQAKKSRIIAKARKKMGVGKNQPSIFEKLTGGPCHQYGVGAPLNK